MSDNSTSSSQQNGTNNLPELITAGSNAGFPKIVLILLAAIPTLLSAWASWTASVTANELRALEKEREFGLKVYDAASDALSGENPKLQLAALALIESIAEEDLRIRLINAFDNSHINSPEVLERTRALLQKYEAPKEPATNEITEQVVVTSSEEYNYSDNAPAYVFGDWDFDLFYCESSSDIAIEQAQSFSTLLREKGAIGRIRLRELSNDSNSRPGYRVKGYQIRRTPDEQAMATQLIELSKNITPSLKGQVFREHTSTQITKWYVSAFFCPD